MTRNNLIDLNYILSFKIGYKTALFSVWGGSQTSTKQVTNRHAVHCMICTHQSVLHSGWNMVKFQNINYFTKLWVTHQCHQEPLSSNRRDITCYVTSLSDKSSSRVTEYQGKPHPNMTQHNPTRWQIPPMSLTFLTKTSFPLTRNCTLNGPEMAKAFAIFRVASFT